MSRQSTAWARRAIAWSASLTLFIGAALCLPAPSSALALRAGAPTATDVPASGAVALGAPALQPLAQTPSRTQPYAACPRPKPRHAACQSIVVPPAAKLSALARSALSTTGGIDGSGLTPTELQSAYELPSASAGEGQTVALVDAYDDPTAESDLATYRSEYGLPACTVATGCLRKVNQTGGSEYPPVAKAEDGDWELEESLDLDMVSAVCPKCHILLVEASSDSFEDLTAAEREAVTLGATEISNSWAAPEFGSETNYDSAFDHPGIPITAASGDDGYDNWELGDSAPSYPAVSPDVIAVGGTVLSRAENARGWSESVWPRSGSGCSVYEPKLPYQSDASCSHRTDNDVAAVAEDLSVYDTSHAQGDGGLPDWVSVGGTSASTPIIAAVEALSEPAERALGAEAFYTSPGSLFDIVSGSNGACSLLYLCEAGGGYDGPTGNGSPDRALSSSVPPPSPLLSVRGYGTGLGTVTSSPGGIDCESACSASFEAGTSVVLTATPSAGASFEGWQGPCSGTGTCIVTLRSGSTVTAVFRAPGSPAGWTQSTLSAPSEREPVRPETSAEGTFYGFSLSASGDARATTLFNPPSDFCYYASTDTGGVFPERKLGSRWISEGRLTAPAVGDEGEARWANCADFGEVTKLSADGSTLLVSQGPAHTYAAERCAAFVYRHGPKGWALEATLFPPGIGPTGTQVEEGCDWFGTQGAISDDGSHIAVMGNRDLYMFARESSGWSLEQQIVLPAGAHCNGSVGVRTLAFSGDGSSVLVGKPNCETSGYFGDGAVYAYSRSSSGWSLEQTIESPEPYSNDGFGDVVAVSEDGATAAISTATNLAGAASTLWVYERRGEGWRERAHVPSPTNTESEFNCPAVIAGGARIVCGASDTVGFNRQQGSVYLIERPPGGWGSSQPSVTRLFATDGFPRDSLGTTGPYFWKGYGVAADGSVIDAPISAFNIANGLYPDALVGYEFDGPPTYSKPTITGFSPAEGGTGTTVTIAGENLLDASAVSFAGTPAASFSAESPTQITATAPLGASSGPISVSTPGGSAASAEGFTFVKPVDAPEVSSVSPSDGVTVGGTAVTITGRHFLAGASVTIGGLASEVKVRSETEITAVTTAESAGSYEVVVSDEAGSSSGGPRYTFAVPKPIVTSITPSRGPATGGTAVTIEGSNFLPGCTVTIGGAASDVEVRSESQITAMTPAQTPGSYQVVVHDAGESSSGGPSFTYLGPAVSGVAPAGGSSGGGTRLTIHGSGFLKGAKVKIGPKGKARDVRVLSETELTATTRAEPPGAYEVIVSDKLGASAAGPSFTYSAEAKHALAGRADARVGRAALTGLALTPPLL